MGDRKKSPSSPSPLLPGTLRFKALWFQLRELGRSVLGRRVSRRRAHLPPDAVAQAAPLRDGSGGEHRPLRPLRGHPHRSGTGTPAAPLHAGPSSASRGWGEGTSAGGRAGRLLPAPGINRGGGIGSGACSAPRPRLGSQPPAARRHRGDSSTSATGQLRRLRRGLRGRQHLAGGPGSPEGRGQAAVVMPPADPQAQDLALLHPRGRARPQS